MGVMGIMGEMKTQSFGPYDGLAARFSVSAMTVRTAFSRKPITYRTALKLSRGLDIPVECFCVKIDKRGKKNAKE